jgi:hypothetical protein
MSLVLILVVVLAVVYAVAAAFLYFGFRKKLPSEVSLLPRRSWPASKSGSGPQGSRSPGG